MSVTINTNVTSLVAQKNLNKSQAALAKNMERLSSGSKLNHAVDNAANMAITKRMDSKITAFNQGVANGNNAISFIQNAEANYEEINNNLQRMRELATQAANGTYTDTDRGEMQSEFTALSDEIQRAAVIADYNGIKLADGSISSITVQVGSENSTSDQLSISLNNLQVSASGLNISSATISTLSGAQSAMDTLESAIDSLSNARSGLGASQSRLETAVRNDVNAIEALSSARSTLADVDYAQEVSSMSKNSILVQASTAMLSQANAMNNTAASLLQG